MGLDNKWDDDIYKMQSICPQILLVKIAKLNVNKITCLSKTQVNDSKNNILQ